MKPEQDRVRMLLTDTVTLLCKNGLVFSRELKIQGTLGITLDNSDVFVVQINEFVVDDKHPTDERYAKNDSEVKLVDSVIINGQNSTKRTSYLEKVKGNKVRRTESSGVEDEFISYSGVNSSVIHRNEKLSPQQQKISEKRVAPSSAELSLEQRASSMCQKETQLDFVKKESVEHDYLDNDLNLAGRENKEVLADGFETRIADSGSGSVYNSSSLVVKNSRKNNDNRKDYSGLSVNRNSSVPTRGDETYYGYTAGNASYDATMYLCEDEFQTANQSACIPALDDAERSYDHDTHDGWGIDTNGNSSYDVGSGDNDSMSFRQLSDNELALMYRPQRAHRRPLTGIKAYSCTMDGCRRTFHRGSEMYRHQRHKHGSGWIRMARSREHYSKRMMQASLTSCVKDVQSAAKIS